ncbi:hypothetical protein Taro_037611, partial [Colocasia esculenta]|nr:hypothetical protein [Colocasia esculenta]
MDMEMGESWLLLSQIHLSYHFRRWSSAWITCSGWRMNLLITFSLAAPTLLS